MEDKGQAVVVAQIRQKTAEKVRADSAAARLTPLASVHSLVSELTPERANEELAGISGDDRYSDIQFATATDGAVYLYSTASLLYEHATALLQLEEAKTALAERIRTDSRDRSKLTSLLDFSPCQAEDVFALWSMARDGRYFDIASIIDSAGTAYLYSEIYLSSAYASVIARVGAGDPAATIAQTVRDQSRTYPNPTNIEVFKDPVFKIDSAKLDACIEDTLTRPQFSDIHRIVHAGTRACYLYSDRYLSEAHARSLVEWLEVGRLQNP